MNEFKYNIDNDLDIVIKTSSNYYGAYLRKNDNQVGRFEIGKIEPHDLTININDEYQGKGYAIKLIGKLCDYLKTSNILNADSKLYIDDDVSHDKDGKSFWDRLGMTRTSRDDKYYGWEKVITFSKLCEFSTSKINEKSNYMSKRTHDSFSECDNNEKYKILVSKNLNILKIMNFLHTYINTTDVKNANKYAKKLYLYYVDFTQLSNFYRDIKILNQTQSSRSTNSIKLERYILELFEQSQTGDVIDFKYTVNTDYGNLIEKLLRMKACKRKRNKASGKRRKSKRRKSKRRKSKRRKSKRRKSQRRKPKNKTTS